MADKRFVDDGVDEIENQSLTDNLTGRTYWIDNGLDSIVKLLNELHEENTELKSILKDILYETEANLSYQEPVCLITVMASPQLYKILTKMLKTRMRENYDR